MQALHAQLRNPLRCFTLPRHTRGVLLARGRRSRKVSLSLLLKTLISILRLSWPVRARVLSTLLHLVSSQVGIMFRQGRRCSALFNGVHDAFVTAGKSSFEAQIAERLLSSKLAGTSGASLTSGTAQFFVAAEPLTLRSLQRAFSSVTRQQGIHASVTSLRQVRGFSLLPYTKDWLYTRLNGKLCHHQPCSMTHLSPLIMSTSYRLMEDYPHMRDACSPQNLLPGKVRSCTCICCRALYATAQLYEDQQQEAL